MKVAYVVSMFPAWAETFILNEMLGVKKEGIELVVFPIRKGPMILHPGTEKIMTHVRYIALPIAWQSLVALVKFALIRPFTLLRVFAKVLWEMRSSLDFLVKSLVLFPQALGFAKIALEEGVDHIHAHWATHTTTIAYIIWRLTGIPYSFTAHAHDIYITRCMLAEKIKHAKFVIVISEFNRKLLKTLYPDIDETKIYIVHTGCDVEKFRPAEGKREEKTPMLISVGRIDVRKIYPNFPEGWLPPRPSFRTIYGRGEKGYPYLLEACALLKKRGAEFRCWIVGDGNLRKELEDMAKELGVDDIVEFKGVVTHDKLPEYYAQADIFVLASLWEGIPVALMEAMASGLAVVATRVTGIPELVEDGVSGLLVPPQDSRALAEAIYKLLQDKELRERMGRAAREKVVAEFDNRKTAKQVAQLLLEHGGR